MRFQKTILGIFFWFKKKRLMKFSKKFNVSIFLDFKHPHRVPTDNLNLIGLKYPLIFEPKIKAFCCFLERVIKSIL